MSSKLIIKKEKIFRVSLIGAVGFFLAIAPVFDPYIIAEIGSGITIRVNDIFMILLGGICFIKSSYPEKNTSFLVVWLLGLGILSLFGNIGSSTSLPNSLKNLTVWMIYAFFLIYIWKQPCRKEFFKWIEMIALIASIVVIMQFVFGYLNIPMWDGKMPILQLSKYDGWAGYVDKNTGDIRPNGIFQEASYFGIYTSVAYAQALKEERIDKCAIFAIAMAFTTSMISIVTLVIVTIVSLIYRKKIKISNRTTYKILIIIFIAVIGLIYLNETNEAIANMIQYIIKRIVNFDSDLNGTRMSSTKYRILGQISLFKDYSVWQKLFGVGIAQYAAYFNVKSYGNIWVTTILNSGIVGVLFLIICVMKLFKRVKKENFVYAIIFLLIISTDYQWFSWYFFYLISASILKEKR